MNFAQAKNRVLEIHPIFPRKYAVRRGACCFLQFPLLRHRSLFTYASALHAEIYHNIPSGLSLPPSSLSSPLSSLFLLAVGLTTCLIHVSHLLAISWLITASRTSPFTRSLAHSPLLTQLSVPPHQH